MWAYISTNQRRHATLRWNKKFVAKFRIAHTFSNVSWNSVYGRKSHCSLIWIKKKRCHGMLLWSWTDSQCKRLSLQQTLVENNVWRTGTFIDNNKTANKDRIIWHQLQLRITSIPPGIYTFSIEDSRIELSRTISNLLRLSTLNFNIPMTSRTCAIDAIMGFSRSTYRNRTIDSILQWSKTFFTVRTVSTTPPHWNNRAQFNMWVF
jgi:hypothetical protein